MRISKHLNVGTCNHQSIQAYECEVIQASGHVIVKECRHVSIQSSKHVINEGFENQSI